MLQGAGKEASPCDGAPHYKRHRPHQPIRQWVLSVPIPLRFLFASCPAIMGKVLGIVYRTIATQLIHEAGHTQATARTGAVTLIQRFGSTLNLNNQS
ncbi:MAG: hypothetical protein BMS9Abin06_0618 [Gammaproteobacteria bacterium]|nr:MAG: hypothetical protein BMS9Abin06_0618 [Gammaproteobacteria bacterium]